jgi:hypothetical protein
MTGHPDILRRTRQSHRIEKFSYDIHGNGFLIVCNFIGPGYGGHKNHRSIGKLEYIHEVAAIALTA